MRVVFLTTSYPRGPDDIAGAFVRDAVEHLRADEIPVAELAQCLRACFGRIHPAQWT